MKLLQQYCFVVCALVLTSCTIAAAGRGRNRRGYGRGGRQSLPIRPETNQPTSSHMTHSSGGGGGSSRKKASGM